LYIFFIFRNFVISGQTSLIAVMIYSQFLIGRYRTSPQTKAVFDAMVQQIDSVAYHPRVPAFVGKGWGMFKSGIASFAVPPSAPQAQAPPQPQPQQ
jgi:hypothetical protein